MPSALLPAIPPRPADRAETYEEHTRRRQAIARHRRFADELFAWIEKNPLLREVGSGYDILQWMPSNWRTLILPEAVPTRFNPPPGFKPWDAPSDFKNPWGLTRARPGNAAEVKALDDD